MYLTASINLVDNISFRCAVVLIKYLQALYDLLYRLHERIH